MNKRPLVPETLVVPLGFAALKLALHALAITNYGWFRDELYYIACSRHLAWGYVDQPPLSIALLAISRAVLGESLIALRTLPALAGAATVVVTGLIARALGGGRFAQSVACLCVVVAPVYLLVDHYFSMNVFDELFWALASLLVIRVVDEPRLRSWLVLGAVIGLGLLNKTSMLWFAGALGAGLLLTPARRQLRTPGPWLAVLVAAVIFAPHVIWQVRHGGPTLEFMRNAAGSKMVRTSFLTFWIQQFLVMSPVTLPVWLGGLVWLLASRRWRILGLIFIAVAALLAASGASRPNYLTVAYFPVLGAGAVMIESFTDRGSRFTRRTAVIALLALGAAPIVPLALPFLPVDRLIAYQKALGLHSRAQERTPEGDLAQPLADMFGWEDLTRRVARVYQRLTPAERADCAIYTSNYGEAAAIDFFGPRYGLPPAISGHNNYWLWGTHGASGAVVIIVGGSRNDPHRDFRSVELADTTDCPHCMPYENGAPIFLCKGLNQPLARRWPDVRSYH
jgi:hypothetical protein